MADHETRRAALASLCRTSRPSALAPDPRRGRLGAKADPPRTTAVWIVVLSLLLLPLVRGIASSASARSSLARAIHQLASTASQIEKPKTGE